VDVVVVGTAYHYPINYLVVLDGFLGVDALQVRKRLQNGLPIIIVFGFNVRPLRVCCLCVLSRVLVIAVHQLVE